MPYIQPRARVVVRFGPNAGRHGQVYSRSDGRLLVLLDDADAITWVEVPRWRVHRERRGTATREHVTSGR